MAQSKSKNKTCDTCEKLCPFIEGDYGNCEIDLKKVNYKTDTCDKYKIRKEYETNISF